MDPIVVKHKKHFLLGLIYMFATGVTGALLYYLRQNFTVPYGLQIITLVVLAEFFISLCYLFKGNSKDIVDADGITTQNLFGTKTRLWDELKCYELGWTYGKKHPFALKEEQLPYVKLVFRNPRKVMRLPYEEQIDLWLRAKCGKPKKDTWTQEKNKPAPEVDPDD